MLFMALHPYYGHLSILFASKVFFQPPNFSVTMLILTELYGTSSMVSQNYTLGQKFGGPSQQNLAIQKHQNFSDFRNRCGVITNTVCNKTSSIRKQHCNLQTTTTPTSALNLVHKGKKNRNRVLTT